MKFLSNVVQCEDEDIKKSYNELEKLVKQEESLMLHQVMANTSETLGMLAIVDGRADEGIAATKAVEEMTDRVLMELKGNVV